MNDQFPIPDLADLALRYQNLPPRSIRWKTDTGRDFLNQLEQATIDHPVRVVAEALQTSHQAIYYMRWRVRLGHTEAWPTGADLRELQAAWRVVEARHARCQQVRRTSPEFERVHIALMTLTQRFSFPLLTSALAISPRHLRRFLDPPLNTRIEAEDLANLVAHYHALPRRLRRGRPAIITAEFCAALHLAHQTVSITKIARTLDMDVTAVTQIIDECGPSPT